MLWFDPVSPVAFSLANDLNPAAGEYMRPALEAVEQLIQSGCINLNECDKIEDNYTQVILRFLISNEELNEMASVKRLVTPTKEFSLGSVYAPFSRVPADRTISPEVLGIKDPLTVQIRTAAFMVGKGELTIDQAIAMYGSFE